MRLIDVEPMNKESNQLGGGTVEVIYTK